MNKQTRPDHPLRRKSDRAFIIPQENWYRDVWLVIITIVVVLIGLKALSVANADRKHRQETILSNCQAQNRNNTSTINSLQKLNNLGDPAEEELSQGIASQITLDQAGPASNSTAARAATTHFRNYLRLAQEERQSQIQASILLINDLQPYKNCTALVHKEAP